MKNLLCFISCLLILVYLQSCVPVFSELQSARLVGDGKVELTPHYSTVSFTEDGETEGLQNHLGLQLAYGLSPKVDLRVRYENVWFKGDGVGDGISIIGFGPKFSIVQDKLALYAPFGTGIAEGLEDAWEFQPTLFLTLPVIPQKLDFTISPKYIFTFCDECEDFLAFNAGLSIGSDVTKWAIRPEYGILLNPGESGHASHFSIGASIVLSK